MDVRYDKPTDMLTITIAQAPSVESEEVREGFVFDYDARGRVVAIEVDQASKRVDLAGLEVDPAFVRSDEPANHKVYTVAMLAPELGVSARALQLTLSAMRASGIQVGRTYGAGSTTLLDEADRERIARWRAAHPRGRPRARAQA